MKTTIKEVAVRQNVESVVDRLKEIETVPTVKIGFIGEFSTGKTSLINSILKLNLPTDIKPCTTAITLIEPRDGINDFEYFVEDSNGRRDVGFSEWSGCDNVNALGIRVKPCDVLPEGCVFVDTPGIHSAIGNEAELTYAYLSNLDAAVFCVTATDGTLNKPAVDFLLHNVPSMIYNRIVFAVTFADKKAENALEEIKKHITNQINNLGIVQNVENKIFYVSSNDEGNAEKLYKFLKSTVLEHLSEIYEDRKNQEYKDVAETLLEILTEKSKLLSLSGDNYYDKIDEEEQKIRKAELGISRAKSKLEQFRSNIKEKIALGLRYGNTEAVAANSSEEAKIAINNMLGLILDQIQKEIDSMIKDFRLPQDVMSNLALELYGRLSGIIKNRDVAVTLTTMVATSVIGGLTGAAGNAIEAIVGGAIQAGGKEVAKSSTKTALANASKELTESISENNTQKNKGVNAIALVANIIETVNPIEHVGNFIANHYKENVFQELIESADAVSVQITRLVSEPFETEYIEPYEKAIFECKRNIQRIKDDKDSFKIEKATLEEDIKLIKAL